MLVKRYCLFFKTTPMRKFWNQIKLFGVGFIGQGIIGSLSNWFLAPVIVGALTPEIAFAVLYVLNLARIRSLIYIYDTVKVDCFLVEKMKSSTKKNKYYVFFTMVLVNNLMGVLYIRVGEYEYNGMPRATMPIFLITIFVSTLALVFGILGAFYLFSFLGELLLKNIEWFLPFMIRL